MMVPFRKGYRKVTVSNTYSTTQDTTYTIPYPYIRPRVINHKVVGPGGTSGAGAGRFLSGNSYFAGAGGGGGGHGDAANVPSETIVVTRNGPVRSQVPASLTNSILSTDGNVLETRAPGSTGNNATPGNPSTIGTGGASPILAGSNGSLPSGSTGGVGGAGGATNYEGEGTNGDGGHGGNGQDSTDGTGSTLNVGKTNGNAGWITYTIEYLV